MIDILAWHRAFVGLPTVTVECCDTWVNDDDRPVGAGFVFSVAGLADNHLIVGDLGGSAWNAWLNGFAMGGFWCEAEGVKRACVALGLVRAFTVLRRVITERFFDE